MENKEAYRKAEQRVRAKIGFFVHLCVYIIVISTLYLINRHTGGIGGYQWFIWPAIGWGIGLFFHLLGVFVFSGTVRERMIQKELERQKKRGA
jgi:uncharacterized membrane protein